MYLVISKILTLLLICNIMYITCDEVSFPIKRMRSEYDPQTGRYVNIEVPPGESLRGPDEIGRLYKEKRAIKRAEELKSKAEPVDKLEKSSSIKSDNNNQEEAETEQIPTVQVEPSDRSNSGRFLVSGKSPKRKLIMANNEVVPDSDFREVKPPVKSEKLDNVDKDGIESDMKIGISDCVTTSKDECKVMFQGANIVYMTYSQDDQKSRLFESHESSFMCANEIITNNLIDAGWYPAKEDTTVKTYKLYVTKSKATESMALVKRPLGKKTHIEDCNTEIYEVDVISPFNCQINIGRQYPVNVILRASDSGFNTINNKESAAYRIIYDDKIITGTVAKGSKDKIVLTSIKSGDIVSVYCGINEAKYRIEIDPIETCRYALSYLHINENADYICANLNTSKLILTLVIVLAFINIMKYLFGTPLAWIAVHLRGVIIVVLSWFIPLKICKTCAYPYFLFHWFHSFHCHDCDAFFQTPAERKQHMKFGHKDSVYVSSLTNHAFYGGFRIISILLKAVLLYLLFVSIRPAFGAQDVQTSDQNSDLEEWLSGHMKGTMISATPLTTPNVISVQSTKMVGDTNYAITNIQMRLKSGTAYEGNLNEKTGDSKSKLPDLQVLVKNSMLIGKYFHLYKTCRISSNSLINMQTANYGGCERCYQMLSSEAPTDSIKSCSTPERAPAFLGTSQTAHCAYCKANIDMNDCYDIYKYNSQSPAYTISMTSYPFHYAIKMDGRNYYKEHLVSIRPYFEEHLMPKIIAVKDGKVYNGNICDLGQYDCFGSYKLGKQSDYREDLKQPYYISGNNAWVDEKLMGYKVNCFYDTFYLHKTLTLIERSEFNPVSSELTLTDLDLGNVDLNLPVLVVEKSLKIEDVNLNTLTCKGCYNCPRGARLITDFAGKKEVISSVKCTGYQTLNRKVVTIEKTKTVALQFYSNIPDPEFVCNGKSIKCDLSDETVSVSQLRSDYRESQGSSSENGKSDLSFEELLNTVKSTYYWFKRKAGIIAAVILVCILMFVLSQLLHGGILNIIFEILVVLYRTFFKHKIPDLTKKLNEYKHSRLNYSKRDEDSDEEIDHFKMETRRLYPSVEVVVPSSPPDERYQSLTKLNKYVSPRSSKF